jgi:hypothetical protein
MNIETPVGDAVNRRLSGARACRPAAPRRGRATGRPASERGEQRGAEGRIRIFMAQIFWHAAASCAFASHPAVTRPAARSSVPTASAVPEGRGEARRPARAPGHHGPRSRWHLPHRISTPLPPPLASARVGDEIAGARRGGACCHPQGLGSSAVLRDDSDCSGAPGRAERSLGWCAAASSHREFVSWATRTTGPRDGGRVPSISHGRGHRFVCARDRYLDAAVLPELLTMQCRRPQLPGIRRVRRPPSTSIAEAELGRRPRLRQAVRRS